MYAENSIQHMYWVYSEDRKNSSNGNKVATPDG